MPDQEQDDDYLSDIEDDLEDSGVNEGPERFHNVLCANGHNWTVEPNELNPAEPCPFCNAKIRWHQFVEEKPEGYTGIELKIKTPAVNCICPHCGDEHVKELEVYEIPPKGVGIHELS